MHNIADVQTGSLQIRPGRAEPPFDDPVGLLVTDCDPASTVEMPASVDVAGALYEGLVGLTMGPMRD
jgi:hypothetical protein